MPSFILLLTWTDQGIRNVKQTTAREADTRAMAEKLGAKVKATYWTMGSYDAVVILEAPDDETATSLALKLGSLGNLRTQTLRAYSREEMDRIISKMQ